MSNSHRLKLKDSNGQEVLEVKLSEVFEFLVSYIRETEFTDLGKYGYELYLPNAMYRYCNTKDLSNPEYYFPQISALFIEGAWQLIQRGILRLGVAAFQEQVTESGSGGMGYSFTIFGKEWLAEDSSEDIFPTDISNYGNIISQFTGLYGSGFVQRADEAVRCYFAHAYYACCAMTGAAAESIALYLATQIDGDEEKIIKEYEKPGGRTSILKIIGKKQKSNNLRQLTAYFELLSYWRDNSSHASKLKVDADEAYTSILLLIKFAVFVRDHINDLVENT